jgi:hypothetical protein
MHATYVISLLSNWPSHSHIHILELSDELKSSISDFSNIAHFALSLIAPHSSPLAQHNTTAPVPVAPSTIGNWPMLPHRLDMIQIGQVLRDRDTGTQFLNWQLVV